MAKIWDYCVFYTADDEEPNCLICDHCQGSDLCDECGPEHWWHYYERKEQDSEMSRLIIALENLGLKEQKR